MDSNSDGVKTAEIGEEAEEIILPWEMNLAPATKEDYKRDARWFLEHGGFVDPKRIHHRPGPDFAAEITSNEVEAGIRRMVEALRRTTPLPGGWSFRSSGGRTSALRRGGSRRRR